MSARVFFALLQTHHQRSPHTLSRTSTHPPTHPTPTQLIFYPTAIGSEPHDAGVDSYAHWTRTMLGHAAANLTPVVASNRVGVEAFDASSITFYGVRGLFGA